MTKKIIELSVLLLVVQEARGQIGHTDVDLWYEGGKIRVENAVNASFFPTKGISRQFQTLPGFASETEAGQGLGPDDQVVYDVLDNLLFWEGNAFAMPVSETRIRIRNKPPTVPDTIVSATSGPQDGSFNPPFNRIGQANGSGNFHVDLQWFLEPNESGLDPPPPAKGAYGVKFHLRTDRDNIAPSDPLIFVFNFGLEDALFDTALDGFRQLLEKPISPGDFDANGSLDVADLDALTSATRDEFDPKFDLDLNGVVDETDRRVWVEELKKTYYGDANLDGKFDSGDLVVVFQQGEYQDIVSRNSAWSDGDWNGDGEFDTADFVLAFQGGGYERGPRTAIRSVAEVFPCWQLVLSLFVFVGIGRFRPWSAPTDRR
jgi:hypothetical protein